MKHASAIMFPGMKLIIAGSRSIDSQAVVFSTIENFLEEHPEIFVTEVVSGKCPRGVDKIGEEWAESRGVPVTPFQAKWRVNGRLNRGAGFARNGEMAIYGEGLLAIWDGKSNGTLNMISQMVKRGKMAVCYF